MIQQVKICDSCRKSQLDGIDNTKFKEIVYWNDDQTEKFMHFCCWECAKKWVFARAEIESALKYKESK